MNKKNTYQLDLKSARVNAKYTQTDVAKIMGVSKQTIINWEKCRIIPKPAQFEMMCKIYGVPKDLVKIE